MNIQDDLYLGSLFTLKATGDANPTLNQGCGPMGRIAYYNVVPLAKGTANIAALQHTVAGAALVLAAGTGITAGVAPDGSGRTVYVLDVPRAISVTTSADMSLVTVTIRGFDVYGNAMTVAKVLPASATTANTLKAFKSVLSVTADVTDGTNNVSIGTSDVLGLPFAVPDAGYITSVKWKNVLAQDAGTFVAAVQTIPSTSLLGDVRGTYTPSDAPDGAKRLVVAMHLQASQCGSGAQVFTTTGPVVGAIGVAQV